MITDDYVSFETAKLLKEKGFDGECDYLYADGKLIRATAFACDWNKGETLFADYENECSAPTLQMAMKWLRKNHNVHCDIGCDDCDWFWNIIGVDKNVPAEDRPLFIKDGLAGYKSYEKACEAAIKYCLENLI